MSTSTIVYVYPLQTNPKPQIQGVFSSPLNAWIFFKNKVGHPPFNGGTFKYSSQFMFEQALNEKIGISKSILIYTDITIEVYIQWDVVK